MLRIRECKIFSLHRITNINIHTFLLQECLTVYKGKKMNYITYQDTRKYVMRKNIQFLINTVKFNAEII